MGVLDIKINEIKNGVLLFNKRDINGIGVYLNNKKVKLRNEDDKWMIDYNFQKDGKYSFQIILLITYLISFLIVLIYFQLIYLILIVLM